jgi:predicted metal-dependent hydrolase
VQQAEWIVGAMARQAGRPRLVPRSYKTGETFFFLGKPLRLEVEHSVWKRVTHEAEVLRVTLADPSNTRRVKELVDVWYRAQAEKHLASYLADALERYRMFIRPARCPLSLRSDACPDGVWLTVRAMKTRWGSCSPDGHISLSTELMHMPRRLIEYVIVHELCHLVRLDHSKAFYFQVARCLPDWQQRRQELETRAWCHVQDKR